MSSKKALLCCQKGVGQVIPDNAYDLTMKFLKETIRIRKKYNYPDDCIINCDETPVNLENPSKKRKRNNIK